MEKREIKFRGKTKQGKWVYGSYIGILDPSKVEDVIVEAFIHEGLRNISTIIPVDPETVGEYTGLLDKHGKPIYEGDVRPNGDHVVYAPAWAKFGWTDGGYLLTINPDEDEVIGNIFENPDLGVLGSNT